MSSRFAEHAAEAFATKCRKCTETQKKNVEKIVVWYTENRPDEWQAMVQKLIEDAKKLNIAITPWWNLLIERTPTIISAYFDFVHLITYKWEIIKEKKSYLVHHV